MLRIIFSILIFLNIGFSEGIDANSKIYQLEKKFLIDECIQSKQANSKDCKCAFESTNQEISFLGILEADIWMENNRELVIGIDNGTMEPTNQFLSYVELYDDFYFTFNVKLDECKRKSNKYKNLEKRKVAK